MIMEQAHENKMTRDETLKVALMVGKILLKSGAETYRVEDTICLLYTSDAADD